MRHRYGVNYVHFILCMLWMIWFKVFMDVYGVQLVTNGYSLKSIIYFLLLNFLLAFLSLKFSFFFQKKNYPTQLAAIGPPPSASC